MSIRYPPEVEAAVRELYETYSSKEIAQILNERFPELPEFTAIKVSSFKSNHGLIPGRSIKPKGISKFPPGLLQFVTENVKGRCTSELAQMVRERFGIDFTVQQARTYIRNHGLVSGYDSRFVKGTPAYNKGMKQEEWLSPEAIERTKGTRFQKGQMPNNHHEVGTVVVTTDGYVARKTAEPNQWEYVHRLVWEEHNGPIPEGGIVIFLDGNPLNCDIGNLHMITRAEHARLNQNHLRFKDPELTKTGITVAKILTAAGSKKKEKKKK
jgi:hypothetical protein